MKNFARNTLLCALTAAASLSATASFAQSDVAIYGRVDLGMQFQSGEKALGKSTTKMDSGTHSGLGFKGHEDLGGGWKAFFQMEHRFDASNGAPKDKKHFFNDISVLGLSGDFGVVRMGRSDNTLDMAADPDAFGGDYVGGRGNRRAGADEKWDNGLMYFTPEIHGFTAVVGAAFSEKATLKNHGKSATAKNPFGVTVLYKHGKLDAALGYMQRANKDKAYGASATYDLGVTKTFLTIAHNDGKGNGMIVDSGENGEPDGKRTTYDLGVAVPVSAAGSVRAKYNLDRRQITPAADTIKTQNFGLGYLHHLSKRTHLYVTGGVKKTDGEKSVRAMDMGVAHSF